MMMIFKIAPGATFSKNTLNFHMVDFDTKENNGVTMDVSWDSSYGPGDDIPFEIIFYDPQGKIIRDFQHHHSMFLPQRPIRP